MCLFYFRPAIGLTLFIPLPLTLDALGNLLMARQPPGSSNVLLKKLFFAGCSKKPRCKAPETLRNEAYLDVRRNDEGLGKRSRWAFFSGLLMGNGIIDTDPISPSFGIIEGLIRHLD